MNRIGVIKYLSSSYIGHIEDSLTGEIFLLTPDSIPKRIRCEVRIGTVVEFRPENSLSGKVAKDVYPTLALDRV